MLLHQACKEARQCNMDLKQQVRHMRNHFLNCVEVSGQEAACLDLQISLNRCSRACKFINTSDEEGRTFILKGKEALEKLPKESTDIEADNDIKRYFRRPKEPENWCLADYVAELDVKYPKANSTDEIYLDNNDDEVQPSDDETKEEFTFVKLKLETKSGLVISQKSVPNVIRFRRYDKKMDPENYYRERLLPILHAEMQSI